MVYHRGDTRGERAFVIIHGAPDTPGHTAFIPTCPISFEPYTHDGPRQPVFLPDCGHTFARRTVESLFEFSRHPCIQCPVCQSKQRSLLAAAQAKPNWDTIQQIPDPEADRDPQVLVSDSSGSTWSIRTLAQYAMSCCWLSVLLSHLFLGDPLLPLGAFVKIARVSASSAVTLLGHARRPLLLMIQLYIYLLRSPFAAFFLLLLVTPCVLFALSWLRIEQSSK